MWEVDCRMAEGMVTRSKTKMQEVEYLEAAVEDMKIDSSLEEVKSEATDVAGNDNNHTV